MLVIVEVNGEKNKYAYMYTRNNIFVLSLNRSDESNVL